MILDLRKKAKNYFENSFLKSMNNAVFRKTMENVIRNRNIKLVTKERRKNCLVLEPNCHTKLPKLSKFFEEYLLAIEMKKQRYL